MSNTKKKRPFNNDSAEIFDEIERELPEDYSDLMADGKRIEPHGRSWLDDDGR